jgi:hypothetical protein
MIAERVSHYRIDFKLGAGGEGYQAQDINPIATLRESLGGQGRLSARFDQLKMVGAWGFEPQTSAVSRPSRVTWDSAQSF